MNRLSLALAVPIGASLIVAPAVLSQAKPLFSPAQVAEGKTLFAAHCAACHGAALDGNDPAPPLKGEMFWSHWKAQPARRLYSRIISTMPLDDPGSLSEHDALAIVSFLAKENGGAIGDTPITGADALNTAALQTADSK